MRTVLSSSALAACMLSAGLATAGESIWNQAATPQVNTADAAAVELGVKWCASTPGKLNGIWFYRAPNNSGPQTVRLWSPGAVLGQFVLAASQPAGVTSPGWTYVSLPTPVSISEGRTYLASYHTASGNYSVDQGYFSGGAARSTWLTTFAPGVEGASSVYRYGALSNAAPTNTFLASNYWVDVEFTPSSLLRTHLIDSCERPAVNVAADTGSVELGIKFIPRQNGRILGVRVYRGATSSWISYPIKLWSAAGASLATGTIPVSQNPTSGWISGFFGTPVNVVAGQTYVASFHAPNGGYSYTQNALASGKIGLGGNIEAPANGGVYAYGATSVFPTNTYASTSYFVDPIYAPN